MAWPGVANAVFAIRIYLPPMSILLEGAAGNGSAGSSAFTRGQIAAFDQMCHPMWRDLVIATIPVRYESENSRKVGTSYTTWPNRLAEWPNKLGRELLLKSTRNQRPTS